MLTLDQIEYYAKMKNRPITNPRAILVEYLQYELLNSLNKNKNSAHLNFIGGTAICLCHHLPRFSEDLDFDNFGLTKDNFKSMAESIKRDLELKGFFIELKFVFSTAFHVYFRFLNLLETYGISRQKGEKILIKLDAVQRENRISPKLIPIDNYGIYEILRVNPIDILLSQKILTILGRKQAKGRDYFDVSYLSGLTPPNMDYLKEFRNIKSTAELKEILSQHISKVQLRALAKDVEPFLFTPEASSRVIEFKRVLDAW